MPENGAPWIAALSSRKTNIMDFVVPAVAPMPEPLRSRWIAALNANEFSMRVLEPEAGLDPEDPSIPEERFAFMYQLYLTDSDDPDEFSSIQFPFTELGYFVDVEE